MKRLLCLLALSSFFCTLDAVSQAPSAASDVGPLDIVTRGFDAYKAKNVDAAVKAWIAGGMLQDNKDALSQVNNLHRMEELFGPYKSWNLIATQSIGSNDVFYYGVMNYRDTAFYVKFEVYRGASGWALNSFLFNGDLEKVFPLSLLDKSIVLVKPAP